MVYLRSDPIATLTQHNHKICLNDLTSNKITEMGTDPLKAQSEIREKLFHAEQQLEFPFTGGVIAAYHYEMGEIFESINKKTTK